VVAPGQGRAGPPVELVVADGLRFDVHAYLLERDGSRIRSEPRDRVAGDVLRTVRRIVVPWTFQLSSVGAGYDAVITASFTYRSSRGLRLAVTPHLTTGGDDVSIA